MNVTQKSLVQVYFDDDTEQHYVKGPHTVLFENGVKVARPDFDDRVANKRTVGQLIAEAAKNPDNCGWDYKAAIKTTGLHRAPNAPIHPSMEKGVQGRRAPARLVAEKKPEVVQAAPEAVGYLEPPPEAAEIGYVSPEETSTASSEQPETEPTPSSTEAAPALLEALPVPQDRPKAFRARMKAFFSAPHTDIIIAILFVGILCVIMSIYHTDMFLIESGKSRLVSIIAAVAMVTFSATAYTAARHVAQDHGIGLFLRVFFSLFLVVCGTSTILFSVFSTINVSYEQFNAKQKEATQVVLATDVAVTSNSTRLDDKQKQLVNADAEVADYTRDVANFYALMSKPVPTSAVEGDPAVQIAMNEKVAASRNYSRAQVKLEQARAKRDKLYAEKDALSASHEAAITTAVNTQTSAYSMVASKLKVAEESIKFIVYVIPAVFFDVIAPFAIAIVLLLKDRRKGIEKISFMDKVSEAVLSKLMRRILHGTNDR